MSLCSTDDQSVEYVYHICKRWLWLFLESGNHSRTIWGNNYVTSNTSEVKQWTYSLLSFTTPSSNSSKYSGNSEDHCDIFDVINILNLLWTWEFSYCKFEFKIIYKNFYKRIKEQAKEIPKLSKQKIKWMNQCPNDR